MKHFIPLGLCLSISLLLISSRLSAQTSISQADANVINKIAIEKTIMLVNYMQMFGDNSLTPFQKKKIMDGDMLDIVDMNAIFTNDLDPTHKTQGNFKVADYFNNISIFYRGRDGVSFRLENITPDRTIYYNQSQKIFFCRVQAVRKLKGFYFHNGDSILHDNTEAMDFFVRVNPHAVEVEKDIKILSMSYHEAISGMQPVEITADAQSMFSTEKVEALRLELERQKVDVSSWRNKADSAHLRAETAQLAALKAQREAEITRRELQLRNLELENARQKAANETRERELIEKEKNALKYMAEKNRIVLKLGGGIGFLDSDDPNSNDDEKNRVTTYHLTGNLNYRLGSVEKLKHANRGTSLSVFYTRDYLNSKATAAFLDVPTTQRTVTGKSTTNEFQGGFVFRQLVRLSAGVGDVSYTVSVIENNVPVDVRVKDTYRTYTIGLFSPSLKNTILVYGNLRFFNLKYPDGSVEDEYWRSTLEFGLQLQIQ